MVWFDLLGDKPFGGQWYEQSPYNGKVGGPFVIVFDDQGSHVPHCAGFGGTGNTEGWTKQYKDVLDDYIPHQDAVDRIASTIGGLMKEHGVTDDACYGGQVDQRVWIKHKTVSFWVWKVCSKVLKLEKCNCEMCCGVDGKPTECEDVTPIPANYRCKQFMQSKSGSFIDMGEEE